MDFFRARLILMPNPHRASASTQALTLVLEYIVTLGNGGGLIFKCHNVFQYSLDAAAATDTDVAARCG